MEINFQNIEEIIFYNSKVWEHIPELSQHYSNWLLSIRVPGLRELGKRAILDFLNNITEESVDKLASFFGEPIFIDKMNDKLTESLSFNIDELEEKICKFDNFNDFCLTRRGNTVFITTWR